MEEKLSKEEIIPIFWTLGYIYLPNFSYFYIALSVYINISCARFSKKQCI